MTREEAKQNLLALGIEEPTDAQVTNYLNQFHSRPQPENKPIQQPQPQPENKPDTPENSELEDLKEQVKRLQKENVQKDIRAYAAEKGLKGEQAEKILVSFQDNLDVAKAAIDSMAEIISESNKTAVANFEKQKLADTPNPSGNSGESNKDEKPDDVKNAESITFGSAATEQSQKDYYKI